MEITKMVFGRPRKRVGPKGYQRSPLRLSHIKSVLAGREWVRESVVVAAVSDVIPPEAAIRALQSKRSRMLPFTPETISQGRVLMVRRRLADFRFRHPEKLSTRQGTHGPEHMLIDSR